MKIFKYDFAPEKIVLDKNTGEPEVLRGKTRKMFFTMNHTAHRIFEELYGEPVLTVLTSEDIKGNNKKNYMKLMTNEKFILSLAGASYLKVDGGKVINNEYTADEFIEIDGIKNIANDFDFVTGLIDMVFDSVPKSKSKKKNDNQRRSKNKKKS